MLTAEKIEHLPLRPLDYNVLCEIGTNGTYKMAAETLWRNWNMNGTQIMKAKLLLEETINFSHVLFIKNGM